MFRWLSTVCGAYCASALCSLLSWPDAVHGASRRGVAAQCCALVNQEAIGWCGWESGASPSLEAGFAAGQLVLGEQLTAWYFAGFSGHMEACFCQMEVPSPNEGLR